MYELCVIFYVSARSEERGLAAVQGLKKEGVSPCFHQLDITDHDSIVKLHNHIKEKYGGLDLLVNNAGMAYKVRLSYHVYGHSIHN